jgi:hypothetical protein
VVAGFIELPARSGQDVLLAEFPWSPHASMIRRSEPPVQNFWTFGPEPVI